MDFQSVFNKLQKQDDLQHWSLGITQSSNGFYFSIIERFGHAPQATHYRFDNIGQVIKFMESDDILEDEDLL